MTTIVRPAERQGTSQHRLVELRKFRLEHLHQVQDLYRVVFGEMEGSRFQARWEWAQRDNLYPSDSPKWVLLGKGRVVGFLATMPLPYWIDGEPIVAHTPCEYMVHPEYRFHGLRLMQSCFNTCPNIVTCDDMGTTRLVERWLGAKLIAPVNRYVRVLDPRALYSNRKWQDVPKGLAWPAAQWLRFRELTLRLKDKAGEVSSGTTVLDERFDAFAEELRHRTPAMLARDSRFLTWRYGPGSPHADSRIGLVRDSAGELAGYVVFHLSRLNRKGRVLDLQTLPSHKHLEAALLSYAVRILRRAGAWSVYYHRLDSPNSIAPGLLESQGFLRRGKHELLVRLSEARLQQVADQSSSWGLSFGDTESSHGYA